jgi:hypothetical protein
MAGTIIADFIRTDASRLSLNVGNTTFATINASGFFSNTGTQLIAANGTVATSALSGTIATSQLADSAITRAKMGYAGAVLQIVTGYLNAQTEGTVASATDLFSASITPQFSTSKVYIMVNMAGCLSRTSGTHGEIWIARGSGRTRLTTFANYMGGPSSVGQEVYPSTTFLDSPATTSSTTYYVRAVRTAGSGTLALNHYAGGSADDRTIYAASTITLMEIAG